ncbi:MAG: STAS domain-containing protein [Acidocella sp.]|nr:STAS domain-containing protein [Acidocella sp.]
MNSNKPSKKSVDRTDFTELPASFSASTISDLINSFLSHRGADLQLSGAEVRKFGAQYLQILLAAQAAWRTDQLQFTILPMSDELTAGIELLGVSPELFSDQREITP